MNICHFPLIPAFVLLACLCAGCKPVAQEYQTPPVEGVVYDLASGRAVGGAMLRFAGLDEPTTRSDASGRFEMPATSRTRAFQVLLPGTAIESLPVIAEHPTHGRGVAWAAKPLKALHEPDTSRLLVLLTRHAPPPPPADCQLDEAQQMARTLLHLSSDPRMLENLRTLATAHPEHAQWLHHNLMEQAYVIERDCGISREVMEEKLNRLEFLASP